MTLRSGGSCRPDVTPANVHSGVVSPDSTVTSGVRTQSLSGTSEFTVKVMGTEVVSAAQKRSTGLADTVTEGSPLAVRLLLADAAFVQPLLPVTVTLRVTPKVAAAPFGLQTYVTL